MPSVRDFLERLRPSGTPGAPSLSGVPADRIAERSAELEALFARLADTQIEAERVRVEAASESQRRREAAAAQARGILAEARRTAESERGATAAAARARAGRVAERIATEAAQESDLVEQRSLGRQAALVELVRAQARAEFDAILADAP